MKSSPPDHGAIAHDEVPQELADLLARSQARLGPLGVPFLFFRTVGSTNDVAASIGAEGTVVLAEQQTAGRGRRGRTWSSPAGSGLYASVVLAPARATLDPLRATMILTLAAGVAIVEAVESATALRADLKWPNDVYKSGRKLAGILAEGRDNVVVLGYGINVSASSYPEDLQERATSLEAELNTPVDRYTVFVETLAAIARRYDDLLNGRFDAILDAWRARAPGATGGRVSWASDRTPRTGLTAGIDDHGALLVRTVERVERIVSGEVTWL